MNRKFRRMMAKKDPEYSQMEQILNPFDTINNLSYHQINGWNFYVKEIFKHGYENSFEELLANSLFNVMNMYLIPTHVFNVEDKDIDIIKKDYDVMQSMDNENFRMIRKCRKKFCTEHVTAILTSDKYIVGLKLNLIPVQRETDSQYSMITYLINKDENYIAVTVLNISTEISILSELVSLDFTKRTSCPFVFITSRKNSIAKRVAASNTDTNIIECMMIHAINTLLHKILDQDCFNTETFSFPTHDPLEMFMFKNIISNYHIKNLVAPVYGYNLDTRSNLSKVILDDEYTDVPDYFGDSKRINGFPLIDLNEKENKFIHNHVVSKVYNGSSTIDVLKYIKNAKYGDTYKLNVSKDHLVVIDINYNEDKNIMRFTLSETLNDGNTYAVVFNFKNITEFSLYDSYINGASYVCMPEMFEPRNTLIGLENETCLMYMTEGKLLNMINYVIEVLIAIHDRPERTKVVKAVDKKYYDLKEKNKPVEEKDYIIVRILKTKKDANEYVSKMTGTRANAEYSVEEWNRKGHWRTNKNGITFWVSDTTCKRHLALTEKEIKIKL